MGAAAGLIAAAGESGELIALTNAVSGLTNAANQANGNSGGGGIMGLIKGIRDAADPSKKLKDALKDLAGALLHPTEMASALTDKLIGMLTGPLEAVNKIAGSIGQFVQLVNPGVMIKFQLAMRDTLAVIGQMLVPAMQSITKYVTMWGDQLAKMQPIFQPLFNEIANWIDMGTIVTRMFVTTLSPLFQVLSDVGSFLSKVMIGAAATLSVFVNTVIRIFGALLGVNSSNRNEDKTSKGAAIRPAEVAGVEEFAKKQFDAIAATVFGQGEEKKTDDFLKGMEDLMKEINGKMDGIVAVAGDVGKAIKSLLDVGGMFNPSQEVLTDAFRWVQKQL